MLLLYLHSFYLLNIFMNRTPYSKKTITTTKIYKKNKQKNNNKKKCCFNICHLIGILAGDSRNTSIPYHILFELNNKWPNSPSHMAKMATVWHDFPKRTLLPIFIRCLILQLKANLYQLKWQQFSSYLWFTAWLHRRIKKATLFRLFSLS